MEREIVFEVLAEGGSISIERAENPEIGFDYFLKTQEAEIFEDETPVNQTNVFDNFYEPFDEINQKYAWYKLHLNYIDEDFSEYATEELVKVLNQKQIETLKNQELLEEKLHCFLNYEEIPEKNGLKRMKISSLVKVTEHEFIERYFENDQEVDKKYQLKGTYEMWTEEQPYYLKNTELINSRNTFEFLGYLEISGNSIILKDEWEEICCVLPSDKYFISLQPAQMIREWSAINY